MFDLIFANISASVPGNTPNRIVQSVAHFVFQPTLRLVQANAYYGDRLLVATMSSSVTSSPREVLVRWLTM